MAPPNHHEHAYCHGAAHAVNCHGALPHAMRLRPYRAYYETTKLPLYIARGFCKSIHPPFELRILGLFTPPCKCSAYYICNQKPPYGTISGKKLYAHNL